MENPHWQERLLTLWNSKSTLLTSYLGYYLHRNANKPYHSSQHSQRMLNTVLTEDVKYSCKKAAATSCYYCQKNMWGLTARWPTPPPGSIRLYQVGAPCYRAELGAFPRAKMRGPFSTIFSLLYYLCSGLCFPVRGVSRDLSKNFSQRCVVYLFPHL